MLKASMAILSKEILENASAEKELILEHLNSVIGYTQNVQNLIFLHESEHANCMTCIHNVAKKCTSVRGILTRTALIKVYRIARNFRGQ